MAVLRDYATSHLGDGQVFLPDPSKLVPASGAFKGHDHSYKPLGIIPDFPGMVVMYCSCGDVIKVEPRKP